MVHRLTRATVPVLLVLAASLAAAPARDPALIALDRRLPEVLFENTPLSDALDLVRDLGGVNLRVDWKLLEQAGIDRTTPISFRLRNVPVRKVLDMLLREAGAGANLTYEIDEGVVEITTQEEADKRLITEVYDVRDLLFTPLDAGAPPEIEFQLEPIERGGGGGGGGTLFGNSGGGGSNRADVPPEQRGQELADIIQSLVRPEVWSVNGGPATIRFLNGTLIVNAPRSVHELIGIPVRP